MLIPFGVFSAAGAGAGGGAGAYELISTAYGTGSSGTITFSSIPSTYKHLQIRFTVRNASSGFYRDIWFTLNSDSSTNYSAHKLTGNGSSVSSSSSVNYTQIVGGNTPDSNMSANSFAGGIFDLLDYASTTKAKTSRLFMGFTDSSYPSVQLTSGRWGSTAAVTSITITNDGSQNFTSQSRFSLYGIKG